MIHAEVERLESHAIEKGLSIAIERPNIQRDLRNVFLPCQLPNCFHQFSSTAVTPEIHLHSDMMNIDYAVGKHKGITRPPYNLTVEITDRSIIGPLDEDPVVTIIQHLAKELGHFIQIRIQFEEIWSRFCMQILDFLVQDRQSLNIFVCSQANSHRKHLHLLQNLILKSLAS